MRFLDGALGAAFHATNLVIVDGVAFTPKMASSFVLISCEVCFGILPDGAIFRRGDATDDGAVDISDPVRSLGYLFLGDKAPRRIDAADANDDGALNIADPIATLTWLFLGGEERCRSTSAASSPPSVTWTWRPERDAFASNCCTASRG